MAERISTILTITFVLLLFNGIANAQQNTVSGTVRDDSTGSPLPGVNIKVKGTTTGTTTNGSGHYSLNVPSLQDTLIFSYIGYKTRTVPINGRTTINLSLKSQTIAGQQMVVVGYGKQKKSELTGSVGSINSKSLQQSSPTNVQEGLEGKIAGVSVTRGSGRPGGNPEIRIRGFNSISGSNTPLFVVDGVIINNARLANQTSPLDYINPQNIKSINVLKDASATAIYGARGANGVVVITTKQPNKNRISYNGSVSMGYLPREIPVLNSKQFFHVKETAYQNAQKYGLKGSIPDPKTIEKKFTSGPSKLFNSQLQPIYSTNWQKKGTRTAISYNHHLSFGGGGNNTNYSVSLGYNNQEGIMLASLSKSYSGRAVVNTKVNDWMTAGGSINYDYEYQQQPQPIPDGGTSPPRQILETPPFLPVKFPNGQYAKPINYPGMDGGGQPVEISYKRQHRLHTNNVIGNAHLKIHLAKGLQFKSTLGLNITDQKDHYFAAPGLQWISTHGNASVSDHNIKSWQEEDQLTYQTNFSGNQSFKGLLAASWQKVHSYYFGASVSSLNSLFYRTNNLGAASVSGIPNSNASSYALNSYFARINYSINSKYNFTVTGRFDGSSKFAKANQYGFFPSGAFAWNISNENFLKNNSTISNLKLRLSYGITGNSRIPNYRTVNQLGNYSYDFNKKLVSGVGIGTLANSSLKWEKDKQADIGIDLGLFSGRLSLTSDVYYKKSTNLLLNAPIPATSGYTSVIRNIGSMENRGLEITLNTTNIRKSNFSWSTHFNISMNRNKVLKLVGGQPIYTFAGIIKEGQPVNSFYGYVNLGTWNTSQAKQAARYGRKPGDIHFADLNNDGKINTHDKKIIGNGLPKGEGSLINTFNYKSFQLVVNLQYEYGNQVDWLTRYELLDRTGIANSFAEVLNAWTPNHQNTNIAQVRPDAGYVKPAENKSSWIFNGSFIRGKRILLAYHFPQNLINKWNIKKLRIYVAADNLFLITSYPGFDPEVNGFRGGFNKGIDQFAYPKPRSFQFGLNFSL